MSETSIKLFDKLKGQFDTVDLYTLPKKDDGTYDTSAELEPTEDPNEAVYFSVSFPMASQKLEVTVDLAKEKSLGVWYSQAVVKSAKDEDLGEFRDLLAQLKPFAQENWRTMDLFDMPKPNLNLDDMKVNAVVSSSEKSGGLGESAFGRPYGSTKTTIQRLGEFNLRIKHKQAVNENGRFRYIKRLYVENRLGERFMLPTTNLAAGRAMLRHYEQGGSLYDNIGQRIMEMARGVDVARSFLTRAYQTNSINEQTSKIVEQVKDYAIETAHMLRRLQSRKVYEYFVKNIQEDQQTEANSGWLENLFTQHVLDEELGKLLPEISSIVTNHKLGEVTVRHDRDEPQNVSVIPNGGLGTWDIPTLKNSLSRQFAEITDMVKNNPKGAEYLVYRAGAIKAKLEALSKSVDYLDKLGRRRVARGKEVDLG
jgi:hypothetical protein